MNTFQEISTHLQKTSSKQIKKWFYFLLIPYLILLISFAIALATSQIRVFFIAGLLVSAFSIGYLFLFLLKKKVDQISKSQIQASFFVEYANIYYQVLNKGLQLLRDSDFTQPTESLKEEESKI